MAEDPAPSELTERQHEILRRVVEEYVATGQPVGYQSFPTMGHSMHGQDPELFAATLIEWAKGLPA